MSVVHERAAAPAARAGAESDSRPDPAASSPADTRRLSDHSRKQFNTLRARAALNGIVLLETTDDSDKPLYVASRWALTRSFDNLLALSQWLDMVTGAKA